VRVSVVISTYNRASVLPATLDALAWQRHDDFEVIVVNGPSVDGTGELLASRPELRAVSTPERNLAVSRNVGIEAASGEIVAFIDDDAVPEPSWLSELVAEYERDPGVAGVGGVVLDQSGTRPQYRFCASDRLGRQDFDLEPPFDPLVVPGADPFLYLTGGNASYRRSALAAVGGFDEEIEYNFEDADLCARLIDGGHRLHAIDGAPVHHKNAPSHLRREAALSLDPFYEVKNRAYFAVRHGRPEHPLDRIVVALSAHLNHLRATAREQRTQGRLSEAEFERIARRADEGLEAGIARGLAAAPQGRPIGAADPTAFRRLPLRRPERRALRVAFLSHDYPPRPAGGIARYTQDLATALAAAGHEAHVLTTTDGPDRVDLEDGVWVHRHPESPRFVPELDGRPLGGLLKRLATAHKAVGRLVEREPLDVVVGPLWAAEPFLCAHDPRWSTVVTCMTPMQIVAETQPAVAARAETAAQVALENATLETARHLHVISQANLEILRRAVPALGDPDPAVIPLGTRDRASDHPRTRPHDDAVEILFAGRLEPRKGVDLLLDAAIPLLREYPRARLRLVGADTGFAVEGRVRYADRLARDAPDVADRVRFDGELDDAALFDAYADCDVFCGPSRYESFGLVFVEAMSFGRPVVGCRAGGVPEIVVDGETGLLVPADDVQALREALSALVADRPLRERMGTAGRARFLAEFEVSAVASRLADHLTSVAPLVAERLSAAAAERPVVAACAALLERHGIDPEPAARAAAQLLAPAAFPVDHEAAVRALGDMDDERFLRGLYTELLGRPPEPEAIRERLALLAGHRSRLALVADVAGSDEGLARGIDPALPERVRGIDPNAILSAVRRAWLADDAGFPAALAAALDVPGDAPALREAIRARLPEGRHAALLDALTRPEVAARLSAASIAALTDAELHTRDDLDAAVDRLTARDDDGFVRGAYQLLLHRPADPGGLAGALGALRDGQTRLELIEGIARAPEALERGLDPEWAVGLAERVPRLQPSSGRAPRVLAKVRRRLDAPDALADRLGEQQQVVERGLERLERLTRADAARLEARLDAIEEALQRERDARERSAADADAALAATEARAVEAAYRRVRHDAIREPQVFGPPERLTIAGTAQVHDALFNTVSGTVTVADHAFFGHGVAILTGSHDISVTGPDRQSAIPEHGNDIEIGEGAWIASRAMLLGPCRIGAHAVVAAGAVVTGDVPQGAIVAGVPGRVLPTEAGPDAT
jgi:glycogen(starch) synthase